jgi:hypothetical protein
MKKRYPGSLYPSHQVRRDERDRGPKLQGGYSSFGQRTFVASTESIFKALERIIGGSTSKDGRHNTVKKFDGSNPLEWITIMRVCEDKIMCVGFLDVIKPHRVNSNANAVGNNLGSPGNHPHPMDDDGGGLNTADLNARYSRNRNYNGDNVGRKNSFAGSDQSRVRFENMHEMKDEQEIKVPDDVHELLFQNNTTSGLMRSTGDNTPSITGNNVNRRSRVNVPEDHPIYLDLIQLQITLVLLQIDNLLEMLYKMMMTSLEKMICNKQSGTIEDV